MKQMTKLENIIMNRSGCNRETANLIANDILQEVEKDLQADVAREIFEEIDEELGGLMNVYHKSKRFSDADVIRYARCLIAKLKKKYTGGEQDAQT